MSNSLTIEPPRSRRRPEGARRLELVVVWCADPSRVGEVLHFSGVEGTFGRGQGGDPPVRLVRSRPDGIVVGPTFDDPHISRRQLSVSAGDPSRLVLKNVGRPTVLVDGAPLGDEPRYAAAGSLVEVRERLLLLVRPQPRWPSVDEVLHPFGEADQDGFVGESEGAWSVRQQVAQLAGRERHALVLGESGSGKELVARALHAGSGRRVRPFVSRNAATFPEGLIDAELFGNVKGYPNPSMIERKGLVGLADGGTLFLDEIGELPQSLQTHLLRLLDDGEYQRLGDGRTRSADLRVIAATNRAPESLKHDLLARFVLRVEVPALRERREDVPLLLRAIARARAAEDPSVAAAVLDESGEPRFSLGFVRELLQDSLDTNVRRLEEAFWAAFRSATPGEELDLPRSWGRSNAVAPEPPPPRFRRPRDIPRDEVLACLQEHGWRIEPAWRALGLRDRYQLRRLREKFDLMNPPSGPADVDEE